MNEQEQSDKANERNWEIKFISRRPKKHWTTAHTTHERVDDETCLGPELGAFMRHIWHWWNRKHLKISFRAQQNEMKTRHRAVVKKNWNILRFSLSDSKWPELRVLCVDVPTTPMTRVREREEKKKVYLLLTYTSRNKKECCAVVDPKRTSDAAMEIAYCLYTTHITDLRYRVCIHE